MESKVSVENVHFFPRPGVSACSGYKSNASMPPLLCMDCRLGQLTIYGPIKDTNSDEIYKRRRSVSTIQAGRTLFREGDRFGLSCILYSGWAFRFKQLADGRRQILSFLIPGDVFPLENLYAPGLAMPFSVKALTDASLCSFRPSDMIDLVHGEGAQSPYVANAISGHLASLDQRLLDIGRKSAQGRLAQLILELERRLSQRHLSVDGEFEFPVSQAHMADALGLTAVYVNRTLDRLRKQGVIEFKRNKMIIKDFEGLRRCAEFD